MTMDLYRLRDRFEQLCRFCLSEDDCIPIFTEDLQLNDQLASLLDILLAKIDDEDGFPNNICAKCVQCVAQFVQFEATCEKSYDTLGRILDLPSPERIESPIKAESAPVECMEPEAVEEYLIEKASQDTEEDCIMDEDEVLVERLEDEPVSVAEEHIDVQEEGVRYNLEEDRTSPIENTSYSITAEQQQMLDAAMQVQSSGFIKRGTRSIPIVECIYCKNTYRGRNTLKKHLRIHLNIKDNQCSYCPRTFTDRSSLRIHEGRHTGKTFRCPHCDKEYYSQNELRQHKTMQHLERKYTCGTCQKKFPSKTILNDHYRVHTLERPFVCTQCGADFKRNRNLVRHQLLHAKYKAKIKLQLNCTVCSEVFNAPNALLEHLKSKHSEALETLRNGSFECPQCDVNSFRDIEECLKHRQVHYDYESSLSVKKRQYTHRQKEASFGCSECGKTFKSKALATKHISTHGDSQHLICDVLDCGLLCKDSSSMEIHRKKSHANEKDPKL
ncbi:AAEL003471-PA [Aedes aegypti]|uniref:AAEL003471-PA n=1 Tax=Aedes aegypti TaxID=7159 RepID=Q17FA8_AEDAE|nr:AAEL003471-PA [Aedes aegypti]